MKFTVGLKNNDTELLECIKKNKEHIFEVYFSCGSFPNGRTNQLYSDTYTSWELQDIQRSMLKELSENGIELNILFNANCSGADSQSRSFFIRVGETVEYVQNTYGLSSVTTTSPLIAKFIHQNFDGLEVRASVNMGIGSIEGMDYVSQYFDSYYLKREYNRDFGKIKKLKEWCDKNGKGLHILANSGCLNNCLAHTFHDNLVAHESEIAQRDNCYSFEGVCHEYLKNPDKHILLVRDTNYIRPEDVHLYEPYFDTMKLATRISDNPSRTVESYIQGKYVGNILELLEPNHAGRIYPYVIDNGKLNNSFLYCDKNCADCSKCRDNYENALVDLSVLA